jgi:hypothetical protein
MVTCRSQTSWYESYSALVFIPASIAQQSQKTCPTCRSHTSYSLTGSLMAVSFMPRRTPACRNDMLHTCVSDTLVRRRSVTAVPGCIAWLLCPVMTSTGRDHNVSSRKEHAILPRCLNLNPVQVSPARMLPHLGLRWGRSTAQLNMIFCFTCSGLLPSATADTKLPWPALLVTAW